MAKKLFMMLLLNLIMLTNICYAYETRFVWDGKDEYKEVAADAADGNLNLESESAILIEQNTGKVLYEKNSHEQLRPASVTKVMSILLIMEAIDSGKIQLTDKVTCSENAASMGGSQIWFEPGEQLTVDETLKAICVVSANDCVVAMAEHLAGSEESFVQQMNQRAKELGMNDTVFKNCHGIDEDGHVTSSYDIALMSRELLRNHSNITKYTTTWMDSLRDGKSELTNTNKLVRTYPGCTGLKTGSTSLALYNLSASATRDNLSLIAVIMRAPTTKLRFGEAKKLLDYGFANFEYKQLGAKEEVIQEVAITKGVENKITAIIENDVGTLITKGNMAEVEKEIQINENITAPIKKGDVVGKIIYKQNEEILIETNLISNKDVEKKSFKSIFFEIVKKSLRLLR